MKNVNHTTNGVYPFFSVVVVVIVVPLSAVCSFSIVILLSLSWCSFFVSLLRTILLDDEQPNSNNQIAIPYFLFSVNYTLNHTLSWKIFALVVPACLLYK